MKSLIATFLSLSIPVTAAAATNGSHSLADRLVNLELQNSSAFEILENLTDHIGPRLSGSASAEAAVQWAVKAFKGWKIDVHTERVMVPHWVRGVETAELPSHHDQKLVVTALGGSVATPPEGITAEVVEVHSFEEMELMGRPKLEGKIVFFSTGMDMDLVRAGKSFEAYSKAVIFRSSGAAKAAQYGAVGVVIRSLGSASLRTPHTGAMRYDLQVPKIPAAAVTIEDALLLHRLLLRQETVMMHLTLTPQTLPDVESANVVAEIRGTDHPENIVLIGAHLDSWDLGTGAIDDGSGVAMVMETLRLIHEQKLYPKSTIRAVLYMNEENGSRGGRGYAEAHAAEMGHHIAAIETDAGAAAPTGFNTTVPAATATTLATDFAWLSKIGANHFSHEDEVGADISFLTDSGVPGFGLVPEPLHYFDYHHTPADTLDKISAKDLAADTAAMLALSWQLANEDLQLPRGEVRSNPRR